MCYSGEWPVLLQPLSSWSTDEILLTHRSWSKKRRWIEYRNLLLSSLSISCLFSSSTDLLSTLSLNVFSITSIPVSCPHRWRFLYYHIILHQLLSTLQISFESWDMVSKRHKISSTIVLASVQNCTWVAQHLQPVSALWTLRFISKAAVSLLFGDQSKLTRCEIRVIVLARELLLSYDIGHQACGH